MTHFHSMANISQPAGDRAMTLKTLCERVNLANVAPNIDSEGQGLVEYALLLFLVSIASMAALSAFGLAIKNDLYEVILALLPF
jgi:Flp pilus assembly pilin Flp